MAESRPAPAPSAPAEAEPAPAAIPETRALRYGLRKDVPSGQILRDLTRIAQCGFNTIIVSAFRQGYTCYHSQAMVRRRAPAIHPAFRRADPMRDVFRFAPALGLSVMAHVEMLNVGSDLIAGIGPLLRKHPRWALRKRRFFERFEGPDRKRYFLDPSLDETRRFLGDIAHELVETYPLQGLYLNDLRYPRDMTDPVFGRRTRDLERYGRNDGLSAEAEERLEAARQALTEPDPFYDLILWRNEQLNETLRYVHCRAERANPQVWIISQASGPSQENRPEERGLQGDWGFWITRQYVDGVAPLYKTDSDEAFVEMLKADAAIIPTDRGLYPLFDRDGLRHNAFRIQACRNLALPGMIFRSFYDLEPEDWEMLSDLFQRPARPMEEDFLESGRLALMECSRILRAHPAHVEFFRDLQKMLPEAFPGDPLAEENRRAKSILGNLAHLEEKIRDGAMGLTAEETTGAQWLHRARRSLAIAQRTPRRS